MTTSPLRAALLSTVLIAAMPAWSQETGTDTQAVEVLATAEAQIADMLSDAQAEAAALIAAAREEATGITDAAMTAASEAATGAQSEAQSVLDAAQAEAGDVMAAAEAQAAGLMAAAQADAMAATQAAETQAADIVAAAEARAARMIDAAGEQARANARAIIEAERAQIAAEEEAARLAAEEAARLAAEEAARVAAADALAACVGTAGAPDASVPVSEDALEAALARLDAARDSCTAVADADDMFRPDGSGAALFHLATIAQTAGEHRDAVELYEEASDLGVAAADTRLGDYYLFGTGPIRPDMDEAAARYTAAYEAGDLAGTTTLGFMHLLGRGVPRDAERMVDLMQEAADGGYHFAQFRLGQIFLTGEGVPRRDQEALGIPNADRALALLTEAGRNGNTEATLTLAEVYAGGAEGLAQDDAARFRWTQAAAEEGLPQAINALGFLYERGIGTLPDAALAAQYYVAALETGDVSVDQLRGTIDGVLPPWDDATARAFQVILQERGLYAGAIDGVVGAGTLAGARSLDDN